MSSVACQQFVEVITDGGNYDMRVQYDESHGHWQVVRHP